MGDLEDDEAERAFQAAMMAQGLMPGDGAQEEPQNEEIDEAERAWLAQQQEATRAGESGAEDEYDSAAERAWEAAKQEPPKQEPLPAHWEGFITHLEGVWDITFSDLKFGEQIGVGAFGSVHKGQYFGTYVAIKTVFTENDEVNMMYLQREINVLKGCRHPNVVQFIGISNDTTNSLLHIVTEYVQEGDLRAKLKDPKVKMPWDVRSRIAHDLASAMAYLHSRSIIHRDLKSKNVLVDHNWRIKICDFGFARTCHAKKRPMTICGTEAWMAPEIIVGQPYGPASDVFSYGIVLCELITRGKVSSMLTRKAEDGFAFPKDKFEEIVTSDTPEDFKTAVLEATIFDSERRPAFTDLAEHFEILTKDLEAVVADQKRNTPSALEKFRSKAAALTVPLIEKGSIRERRNGLQRMAAESKEPAVVVKAVPLREQKSTRRVQVPNNRVSAVHALIGGQISQTMGRPTTNTRALPPLGAAPSRGPGAAGRPATAKPTPKPGAAKPAPVPATKLSGRGQQLPLPTGPSPRDSSPRTTSSNRPLPSPPPKKPGSPEGSMKPEGS